MKPDPAAIQHDLHAATNAQDFAWVEALFAPSAVYISGGVGGRIEGRDDIMAAFRTYFVEYPDQVAVDHKVEQRTPNTARALWSLTARSARTGAALVRSGTETITIDDAGLIVRVEVEG